MAAIKFLPFGKSVEADGAKDLLELARDAQIPIQSTCGGKGKCGKCAVIIGATEVPLPPPSAREKTALGGKAQNGYRLACETRIAQGAVVVIPEESCVSEPVILTRLGKEFVPFRVQPSLRQLSLTVPPPAMNPVVADRERLLFSLKETHGRKRVSIHPHILRKLPGVLRAEGGRVTVTLTGKHGIVDVNAGKGTGFFGIAFDLGTTTVVAFLTDLTNGHLLSVRAALNPQIRHGDDVITRISFCGETEDGLEALRRMVVSRLNTLIAETCGEAGIRRDQILEATLVGNTAMHHLFMGLDPRYLAMAPYTPVLQESQDIDARDLSIDISPSANVHLLPLKAGFVGSDTIACILATGLNQSKSLTLLIDLGTNGEIVFGNRDRLLCCSTAAGPAFEGGHIRWGMRASSGAIERVSINADTFDVTWKTIGGEKPVGICGSGVISAVAEMIRAGIILARGNFNEDVKSDRLRTGDDGLEFVLVRAFETGVGQDIVITRKDVSELQMAKSAVHAGSTLLMEEWKGGAAKRILLAGAGGNYIDPNDACAIDLFPGCVNGKIEGVGNAAGHGAYLALVDQKCRKSADKIALELEYFELSADARFQELFVSGMFFTAARDFEGDF